MTFDEAVKKSIKVFLKGTMPIKTGELKEDGLVFTPEYFDQLESELSGETNKSKNKKDRELKDEA